MVRVCDVKYLHGRNVRTFILWQDEDCPSRPRVNEFVGTHLRQQMKTRRYTVLQFHKEVSRPSISFARSLRNVFPLVQVRVQKKV